MEKDRLTGGGGGGGGGGAAKIAIRNEVARTGRYFSTASECVQFLKKKFEGKTNPCYYIEELHTDDLNEKRGTQVHDIQNY